MKIEISWTWEDGRGEYRTWNINEDSLFLANEIRELLEQGAENITINKG